MRKLLVMISILIIASIMLSACGTSPTPAVQDPTEPAAPVVEDPTEPAAPVVEDPTEPAAPASKIKVRWFT